MKNKKQRNDGILMMDITPSILRAHPLNRAFARKGAEWEEFVESVRTAGRVRVPLHAREMEDGKYELMAGHRRAAAAHECGLETVPVVVESGVDDVAALVFLVNENMQRLDLSPVDEARLCAAMRDEMALSESDIAARVSRSVSWVRTRQLMLELGDEVLDAVCSKDADRHLSLASVEEVLRVPECWRAEAAQMVLHPEFELRPLGPEAAREVLRVCLLEPKKAEVAWNGGREKLAKIWRKRLKDGLTKAEAEGLLVMAVDWADRETEARGAAEAEDRVPDEMKTDAAPPELKWIQMAVRHGLAARVIPGKDEEESRAVVDARVLREAEAARAEYDQEAWLTAANPRAKDARAEAAKAALDGEGEMSYEDGEAPKKVIEQTMDHWGWVDLGKVLVLRKWAEGYPLVESAEGDLPNWARCLDKGLVVDVCEWVEGLKR